PIVRRRISISARRRAIAGAAVAVAGAHAFVAAQTPFAVLVARAGGVHTGGRRLDVAAARIIGDSERSDTEGDDFRDESVAEHEWSFPQTSLDGCRSPRRRGGRRPAVRAEFRARPELLAAAGAVTLRLRERRSALRAELSTRLLRAALRARHLRRGRGRV